MSIEPAARPTTIDVTPVAERCGCPALPEIPRRSFLKAAGAAGIVAGLASEGMFTRLAFGAEYSGDVLVVLSLRGGMDSLHAVVPASAQQYGHYATWRPHIAVPQGQLTERYKLVQKAAAATGHHARFRPLPVTRATLSFAIRWASRGAQASHARRIASRPCRRPRSNSPGA